MRYLRPVVGQVPIYPFVWMEGGNTRLLKENIRAVKRNGMDGYFVGQWEAELTEDILDALI